MSIYAIILIICGVAFVLSLGAMIMLDELRHEALFVFCAVCILISVIAAFITGLSWLVNNHQQSQARQASAAKQQSLPHLRATMEQIVRAEISIQNRTDRYTDSITDLVIVDPRIDDALDEHNLSLKLSLGSALNAVAINISDMHGNELQRHLVVDS